MSSRRTVGAPKESVAIEPETTAQEGDPFATLSPGLRTTLLLLSQGLEKAALRLALGLTDAALRKRFQALRAHGPLERPSLPTPPRTPALSQLRRSQVDVLPPARSGMDWHKSERSRASTGPRRRGS